MATQAADQTAQVEAAVVEREWDQPCDSGE
jgi:hypothetical protein